MLGDLPAEALKAAVRKYLATSEYPGLPPVGQLRRLASEAIGGERLTAGEAWDRVLRTVRRHGDYDPQGGWPRWTNSQSRPFVALAGS